MEFDRTWLLSVKIFLEMCKKVLRKGKYFSSNTLLQCYSKVAAVCLPNVSSHLWTSVLTGNLHHDARWTGSSGMLLEGVPPTFKNINIKKDSNSVWKHVDFQLQTYIFFCFALPSTFFLKHFFLLPEKKKNQHHKLSAFELAVKAFLMAINISTQPADMNR